MNARTLLLLPSVYLIPICSFLLIVIRPPAVVCLLCQWDSLPLRMLTRRILMTSRKVQLIRRILRVRAASLIMILTLRLEDPQAHLQQLHLQDQKLQVYTIIICQYMRYWCLYSAIRFKDSPFFTIDQAVSAVIECPGKPCVVGAVWGAQRSI